jgi:hypothetical protein
MRFENPLFVGCHTAKYFATTQLIALEKKKIAFCNFFGKDPEFF